ncbi:MAG: hypothetical protein ACKVU4_10650 [Phycisphaerales bacterium]
MAGRKRSGKRQSALLRDFLRLGNLVDMHVAIEDMGADASAAWLEILTELAPHSPIEGGWGDPEAAAFRALVLGLARRGQQELAPLLNEYCRNAPLNRCVVQALATLGQPESLAVLRTALDRDEESMDSAVAGGIRSCAEANRGDPRFLAGAFELLSRYLLAGARKSTDTICEALLALDRERATEALLGSAILTASRRDLADVLKALGNVGVLIPRDRLVRLLAEVVADASAPANALIMRGVLSTLQRTDPIGAEPIVDAALESSEPLIRHAAVDAKLEICGLHGLCDEFSDGQRARWPREIEIVETLCHLHLDVESNGLSSVFSNHRLLWWREVVPLLREVGAEAWANALTELARNRGLDDPKLSEEDAEAVRWPPVVFERETRLGESWGNQLEDLIVVLCRYTLARPDAFRKRSQRISFPG